MLISIVEAVKEVQWNRAGTQVITASYDKTVKLHDVETGIAIQVNSSLGYRQRGIRGECEMAEGDKRRALITTIHHSLTF